MLRGSTCSAQPPASRNCTPSAPPAAPSPRWATPSHAEPRAPGARVRRVGGSGRSDPGAENVWFKPGDGLKTVDAVADRAGPAATLEPSYAAFTAAGLV